MKSLTEAVNRQWFLTADAVSAAAIGAGCGELLLLSSLTQKSWPTYLAGTILLYLLNIRLNDPLGRLVTSRFHHYQAGGNGVSLQSRLALNLLILIGLVISGLISDIISSNLLASFFVLISSLLSAGIITLAWISGARRGARKSAAYGATAGFASEATLLAVFSLITRGNSDAGSALGAWVILRVVRMALLGGLIGLLIDKSTHGRIAPRIAISLVLIMLAFALLLPCALSECPRMDDLLSTLLIVGGWGLGLLLCKSTEMVLGVSAK